MLLRTSYNLGHRAWALPVRRARLHVTAKAAGGLSVYAHLAADLKAGDIYCLFGDVGAGKSVWSRAFIRAAAQDPELPVPSPTFLLQNVYDDHGKPEIHHFDLYRLAGEQDLLRLNLQESFSCAVCLVEWAERLQHATPAEHLAVQIKIIGDQPHGHSSGLKAPVAAQGEQTALGNDGGGDDLDAEDVFSDRRCRLVTLVPHGARWEQRLSSLEGLLAENRFPRKADGSFLTC